MADTTFDSSTPLPEMHFGEDWSSLLNKNVDDAKVIIQRDRPDVEIDVLEQNSMVTMDYRMNRVRVFINPETQTVTAIPRIG